MRPFTLWLPQRQRPEGLPRAGVGDAVALATHAGRGAGGADERDALAPLDTARYAYGHAGGRLRRRRSVGEAQGCREGRTHELGGAA